MNVLQECVGTYLCEELQGVVDPVRSRILLEVLGDKIFRLAT